MRWHFSSTKSTRQYLNFVVLIKPTRQERLSRRKAIDNEGHSRNLKPTLLIAIETGVSSSWLLADVSGVYLLLTFSFYHLIVILLGRDALVTQCYFRIVVSPPPQKKDMSTFLIVMSYTPEHQIFHMMSLFSLALNRVLSFRVLKVYLRRIYRSPKSSSWELCRSAHFLAV